MSLSAVAYAALFGLSATITGGLAGYAWRHRTEPGARPFAGLMAAVTLWACCATATVLTPDEGTHLTIEWIQWIGIAFVPVFMLLFALSYTGYDEFASPRTFGVLSIFPLVTIGAVLSNRWRDLLWTNASVVVVDGAAFSTESYGILYYAFALYAYVLIIVGALLIIRLVMVSDYLFSDQAALLVVGVITPVIANAVTVAGFVPFRGFEVTPFAFSITGLTFGYALFRRRLFELVPATRRLGRDAAITSLDDGVLILDTTYCVIYLNPKAADTLDCDPGEALGASATDLLDTSSIDFDVPDALAELDIGDRFYGVRASAITDRRDHEIGHTLVLHDITARKRREDRLRRQRDELEAFDRLNEAIRGATQAFVNATTRTAIEDVVCDRLTTPDLYAEASMVIDSTDEIVTGDGESEMGDAGTSVTIPVENPTGESDSLPTDVSLDVLETEHGAWATIPLGYDRSIYGALVVYTTRSDAFGSRERAILGQFGETVSQAINAVENRRLLLADTVIELEFRCPDAALAALARSADCHLSFRGLVPAHDSTVLVYYRVDGSAEHIVNTASGIEGIETARIADDTDGIVEFALVGRSALLALSEAETNIRTAEATTEAYRISVEVAPETDVRALTECVREACPGATLAAKHDSERFVRTDWDEMRSDDAFADLTERQREVLEAAYRAGYFRWPRDRTAEEVADSVGISSPTLHKHLRRAEERLLDELFDAESEAEHSRTRD